MKSELTPTQVELAKQRALRKYATRKNFKKAAQIPLVVGHVVGMVLIPAGMWLDDYMPIIPAVAIVGAFQLTACWLAIAMAVSLFDSLQSDDETRKLFGNN